MATGICVVCGKTRGTTEKPWSVIVQDGKQLNAHVTCAKGFKSLVRTAQAITNESGEFLRVPDYFTTGRRR